MFLPCCIIPTLGLLRWACAESMATRQALLVSSLAMTVCSSLARVMLVLKNNSSLTFNLWSVFRLCWRIRARCCFRCSFFILHALGTVMICSAGGMVVVVLGFGRWGVDISSGKYCEGIMSFNGKLLYYFRAVPFCD